MQIGQINALNKVPGPLLALPDAKAAVHAVGFAPLKQGDSYRLAAGTEDGRVCSWRIDSSAGRSPAPPCRNLTSSAEGVTSLAFSENGDVLGVGTGDGQILLRKSSELDQIEAPHLSGHSGAVKALAFSPDGKFLLSASENDGIKLWGVP